MAEKVLPTTSAFEAALAAMNRAKATAIAVTPPSPDDSGQGKVSTPPHQEISVNDASSGGGGNGGSTRNGGPGSGGDSSKGWFMKKSTVLVVATLISAFSTLYFMVWKTTDKGIAADKENNTIRVLQAQTEVLKASAAAGVLPQGFEQNRLPQQQIQPQSIAAEAVTKEVVIVTTFGDRGPESTSDEVEQLFISNPVWNIDGRFQSLRVGKGYAKVKLGNLTSFEGRNFVVSVAEKDVKPDGRPGYFFKCGDVPQLKDSERGNCFGFMKLHQGLEVRFAVFDGGYVKAD